MSNANVPSPLQENNTLTSLPTEVWWKIFKIATYITGAFDIENHDAVAAFIRDGDGISLQKAYTEAIRLKVALNETSTALHRVTRRTLFEHIRIHSGEQAIKIASVLRHPGQDSEDRPGKWIRRIDIALEGTHEWTMEHTDAMKDILLHSPRLVCFSTVFTDCFIRPSVYRSTTLILALGQCPCLKRVELGVSFPVLQHLQTALLTRNVELLWIKLVDSSIDLGPGVQEEDELFAKAMSVQVLDEADTRQGLPRLQFLAFSDGCQPFVDKIYTPCLRTCIMGYRSSFSFPLLEASRIEYVMSAGVSESANLDRDLKQLQLWSNLKVFGIKYFELGIACSTSFKDFIHPSVTCLLIEDISFHHYGCSDEGTRDRLQSNMKMLVSSTTFPSLEVVRLCLPVRSREEEHLRREIAFWEYWSHMSDPLNFHIEVSCGQDEWRLNHWTRGTLRDHQLHLASVQQEAKSEQEL